MLQLIDSIVLVLLSVLCYLFSSFLVFILLNNLQSNYFRGLSVGIYTTNSADAVVYVMNSSESQICVVENDVQLQKVLSTWDQMPSLKAVVQYVGKPSVEKENVYSVSQVPLRHVELELVYVYAHTHRRHVQAKEFILLNFLQQETRCSIFLFNTKYRMTRGALDGTLTALWEVCRQTYCLFGDYVRSK